MEEVVLQNLLTGDSEAQIQAATELPRFTAKQRHKLAERGVMVPLISMLHSHSHSHHVEAIEVALFSLLSLAFGSERYKSRIVKSGALPVLLNLLQCKSKAVIELTIAALLVLSSCKANKLPIAASGVIQLMVEILNVESVSMQARLDAIATIHNLSTCRQIIPSLVSSGVVFFLLQIIHSSEKQSQLAEKAIGVLDDVVSSSKNGLKEACGGIWALVETIEEGTMKCKEHAVRILLLICQSCREKYRGLILREGAMPGLLQLSVDGTRQAKTTARELLFLLRDCSGYGSRHKQSRNKAIEQIMEEIDAEGVHVVGTNTNTTTALRLVEEMLAKLSGTV